MGGEYDLTLVILLVDGWQNLLYTVFIYSEFLQAPRRTAVSIHRGNHAASTRTTTDRGISFDAESRAGSFTRLCADAGSKACAATSTFGYQRQGASGLHFAWPCFWRNLALHPAHRALAAVTLRATSSFDRRLTAGRVLLDSRQ